MNLEAPPEAGAVLVPRLPLMSRKSAVMIAVATVALFGLILLLAGIQAGLDCALASCGLFLGFVALIYGFRVIQRRLGVMPTLLAVHEHGLLIRKRGHTLFTHWRDITKLAHLEALYQGVMLYRHTVHFTDGSTMTYGGDLWSERDCQRISEIIERVLYARQDAQPR